jgi:hypothetical protein
MTAAYCLFATLLFAASALLAQVGVNGPGVNAVLVVMTSSLLVLLWRSEKNILISPVRLYVISVMAFILARPLISLFISVDLVEVGAGITDANLTFTLSIVSISVGVTALTYFVARTTARPDAFMSPVRLRLRLPPEIRWLALAATILLGIVFLYLSWVASQSLGVTDYFSAMDNPEFHAHIRFFFLAKMCSIIWLVSNPDRDNFQKCAGLLSLFAIGFLLIGLRGYFLSYLFLWIYFFNEKKQINGLTVLLGSVALLYLASLVLEYRLGVVIYDNFLQMVSMPLYQQGASFEVVFGALNFPKELDRCLPIVDYLTGKGSFGACVDLVRKVPFDEGGYASSFFAEAYYLGFPALVVISALLGYAVRLTQHLSQSRTGRGRSHTSFVAGLVLFYVLPNLVYFARSSAFDFIVKLAATLVLCLFLFNIGKRKKPLAAATT